MGSTPTTESFFNFRFHYRHIQILSKQMCALILEMIEQALLTLQNRVTFVRQSSKHSMMYYLILLAWHTKYTIWIFAVTCCVALFTNEKERLQAWTEHEGNRILNSVRFLGLPDKIVFIGHTLISMRSSIN